MITYSLISPSEQYGFAVDGDEWRSPKGHSPSFKRVMHGGDWVDAQEDENHGEQQEPGSEAGRQSGEISGGPDQSASGNGNDGEALPESGDEEEDSDVEGEDDWDGDEDQDVNAPAGHETNDDVSETGEPLTSTGPIEADGEGEGVDANGSPVV